jgi:dihydroorotase
MSSNVAGAFNIHNKGRLQVGCCGDVTIVDHKKVWTVDATEFQTKCKWSPFEGRELKGKVHSVIKGGELLYQEFGFVG